MAEQFDPTTYASTKLRWGFFISDHPGAPKPTYSVVPGAELEIPPEFGGDLDYVVCHLFDETGVMIAEDHKEIPLEEERWSGAKGSRVKKMVAFEKNPDSWRKLIGQALGRTLTRAGYPDSMNDLKPLLLWKQRNLEMRGALGPGVLSPARAITQGDDFAGALEAAATPTRDEGVIDLVESDPETGPDDVAVGDAPLPLGLDDPRTGEALTPELVDGMDRRHLVTQLGDLQLPTAGNEATLRARLKGAIAPFEDAAAS